MNCPLCEFRLPDENTPAMCPNCGGDLAAAQRLAGLVEKAGPGDEPSPGMSSGLLSALKLLLWTIVFIAGAAFVLLAIVFAGCLFLANK